MAEIGNSFCPNKDCKDYRIQNRGNIKYRGKYGKDKTKNLLYCRTCGKRFASTRATAFFGLHLSDEKIGQIIHHAAEGVGVRATARLLGLDKDTVNRVILRAGEHCQLVLSSLLRSLKLKEAQLDELWAFVKKRNVLANKSLSKNMEKSGSGQPFDTTTKLIVCFLIGDRTLEQARDFLKDLVSRTEEVPLFTSDELPHYADGLKELFHMLIPPGPTGRPGRPRNPEKVVDKELDYASVHISKNRIFDFSLKIKISSSFSNSKCLSVHACFK